MLTLPDRDGDPADSHFGRPRADNLHTNGFTPTKEASFPHDDTPFLEFVGCFLCHAALPNATKEGRKFWITSCDHVLCSRHDHEEGRCTSCGQTGITAYIINKDLPQEMRDYLRTGPQVCEKVKGAAATAERSARALAFQNEQLTRTVRHLRKTLHITQEKASATKTLLETTGAERANWEAEKAAFQAQVAELKNTIAANDRRLSAFAPMASAGVMPSIPEERSSEGSMYGKRMREDEPSPGPAHKSVDRITMAPMRSSSSASHSSPRSLGQVKTNIAQYRYNPSPAPQPQPQTPMGPYRSQSVAPPQSAFVPRIMPMAQYQHISTPVPNNVVARLRQNGRSERDDSPSRPATAQAMSYPQPHQSPMINGGRGSPYPQHGSTYNDHPQPRYQGPPMTPRPYPGTRF